MIKHKGTQTIMTDRLTLRRFVLDDSKDAFEKWTSSYETSRFVMYCPHNNIDETEQMLKEYVKNYDKPDFYMWGIVFEDNLIGYICGNEISEGIRSICIGYCITKYCWDKGITTEATKAVIEYFFSVGFNRIFSYHNPLNPASGRVMQKCGMTYEGRIRGGSSLAGEICDCLQYSVLKSDYAMLLEIKLIKPTMEYAADIMSFRQEILDSNCSFAGCGSLRNCVSANEWIEILDKMENEDTCPEGGVTSNTYIAVRLSDNKVVGIIDLRHHINHPILSVWGGHMGYSVRPSERRKGYAKEMLRQNLLNCKTRGLSKVLITCDYDNIGSEKTIIANGGVFEKEICVDGDRINRYWIVI